MKTVLIFILALSGSFLFASEEDTSTYDTNYRLYYVQREKVVDSTVKFRQEMPEDMLERNDDNFMNGPVSGGHHPIGGNYDSIHNINPKVAGFISVCFLSFVGYIIFRVRRSLKKDKRKRKR